MNASIIAESCTVFDLFRRSFSESSVFFASGTPKKLPLTRDAEAKLKCVGKPR